MPIKGKLPRWEKEENRTKIFLRLLDEPLSFTELLNSLEISRGALSDHLKSLEKSEIIRRTRKDGKRVYELIFDDEEKIMDELKAIHFDFLLEMFAQLTDSFISEWWQSYSDTLLRITLHIKKKKLMGEPQMSIKEMFTFIYNSAKKNASPKLQALLNVDENLEHLKETPDSEFDDLEQTMIHLGNKLKRRKKQ